MKSLRLNLIQVSFWITEADMQLPTLFFKNVVKQQLETNCNQTRCVFERVSLQNKETHELCSSSDVKSVLKEIPKGIWRDRVTFFRRECKRFRASLVE